MQEPEDGDGVMGSFITRKKEKVAHVLAMLGDFHTEERFLALFKEPYPSDWLKIQQKWQEEDSAGPGKGHPMQHPDVYMKEMYRNGLCRMKGKEE